jgi:hypothetical protein
VLQPERRLRRLHQLLRERHRIRLRIGRLVLPGVKHLSCVLRQRRALRRIPVQLRLRLLLVRLNRERPQPARPQREPPALKQPVVGVLPRHAVELLRLHPQRPDDQRQLHGRPLLTPRLRHLLHGHLLRPHHEPDRLLLPPELRLLPQPGLIQRRRQRLEQLPERAEHLQPADGPVELSEAAVVSVRERLLAVRESGELAERGQRLQPRHGDRQQHPTAQWHYHRGLVVKDHSLADHRRPSPECRVHRLRPEHASHHLSREHPRAGGHRPVSGPAGGAGVACAPWHGAPHRHVRSPADHSAGATRPSDLRLLLELSQYHLQQLAIQRVRQRGPRRRRSNIGQLGLLWLRRGRGCRRHRRVFGLGCPGNRVHRGRDFIQHQMRPRWRRRRG